MPTLLLPLLATDHHARHRAGGAAQRQGDHAGGGRCAALRATRHPLAFVPAQLCSRAICKRTQSALAAANPCMIRRHLQQSHCGVWGADGGPAGRSHLRHRGWALLLPLVAAAACCCCRRHRCCRCLIILPAGPCSARLPALVCEWLPMHTGHDGRPAPSPRAGQGGQQHNNGVQIAHQTFEKSGNAGMVLAQQEGSPVRLWLKVCKGWGGAAGTAAAVNCAGLPCTCMPLALPQCCACHPASSRTDCCAGCRLMLCCCCCLAPCLPPRSQCPMTS